MSNQNKLSYQDAINVAKQQHLAGNLMAAEQVYKDILKALPNDYNSLYYLGVISYQLGNLDAGLEYTQKAIEQNDTLPESWNAYAIMTAEQGDKEKAIEFWLKAIALNPDFADAHSNIGNAYWETGDFNLSKKHCEMAVKIRPDHPGSYLNLGNALMGLNHTDDAIETWKKLLEQDPQNAKAYINLGNAYRELEDYDKSEEFCLKALELAPDDPNALMNLGSVRQCMEKYEEAEQIYRQVTSICPTHAVAHCNLAISLISLNRYEEAITSLKYALAFEPEYLDALNHLTYALFETNKLIEAERIAKKAYSIDKENSEIQLNLAEIMFSLDRFEEARIVFDEALANNPDDPQLLLRFSIVLERLNRMDEAIDIIKRVISKSQDSAQAWCRMANIYYMANDMDKALESTNKSLEIDPNFALSLAVKSEILQSKGQMKEAEEWARKAIQANPDMPLPYFTLSKIKKFEKGDPDLKQMEAINQNAQAHITDQQITLNFSLFKAYEDLKEYDKAFEFLRAGNDLKYSSLYFDKSIMARSLDTIKRGWTPEIVQQYQNKGSQDQTPIFILGMARSGTTLTEQIIASHPDVYGAGELTFMNQIETKLGMITPETCQKIGDHYVQNIRAINDESKSAKFITDKMPGNYSKIGLILSALPNAKIIHCKRNPIDNCLSCYKQLFAIGHAWTYNFDMLAQQYEMYMNIMAHWRELYPDRFLEINYEDTVEDFENQARLLIDYVGLTWNDACLTPHKSKRAIATASKGQVRQPIYKTSVESWRRYEEHLEPLMTGLAPFVGKNRRQKVV